MKMIIAERGEHVKHLASQWATRCCFLLSSESFTPPSLFLFSAKKLGCARVAMDCGVLFLPIVGKYHPSIIAPSPKKVSAGGFSFIPWPTNFFGVPRRPCDSPTKDLFSSIHNPMVHIAARNPTPSVGVGLGGFACSLLLSSVFCHFDFFHRGPGASSRYPPRRLSLLPSGLGSSPHRSSFPEKARSFSAYDLAAPAISPSSRYHFFRGPIFP